MSKAVQLEAMCKPSPIMNVVLIESTDEDKGYLVGIEVYHLHVYSVYTRICRVFTGCFAA